MCLTDRLCGDPVPLRKFFIIRARMTSAADPCFLRGLGSLSAWPLCTSDAPGVSLPRSVETGSV
eukprot:CAMPEP_0206278538 /NCGR_PEP_ID=MMETSP0047_2-20121206/37477_1 /ASSEMBLY_ACC=CAM_ASM_000192 /TAXON_ID=195065 /ORGANISM="Chroomonas mesostigmatica_cf, Strain CCMP1168" /LENGTH=63 /DNA_ID=CAMNT_0053708297 /DNA_START=46 /DNA_END=234 /DNA_ORIENTATION=-